jgi:hypothetical protein
MATRGHRGASALVGADSLRALREAPDLQGMPSYDDPTDQIVQQTALTPWQMGGSLTLDVTFTIASNVFATSHGRIHPAPPWERLCEN